MHEAATGKQTLRQIIGHIDDLAGLNRLWTRGAVHRGGPHYRLSGTAGPISFGEDECGIIGCIIEAVRPKRCFMIGNAFGLSSVYIAKMMEYNGGEGVVTLDNQSEGPGVRCAEVAENLRQRMNCALLTNCKGTSPEDIGSAAKGHLYDFVIVDGSHRHPQVTVDFKAVRNIATEDAVFCWHDYWMSGIPQCVTYAEQSGYHCLKINSSCELVLGTKAKPVFDKINALFDNTERPQPRLRPVAFGKLCYALLSATVKSRIGGVRPPK